MRAILCLDVNLLPCKVLFEEILKLDKSGTLYKGFLSETYHVRFI